jgi:antitoxin StbD
VIELTRLENNTIISTIFCSKLNTYKNTMVNQIFSQYTVSISDLKKHPMAAVNATHGQPLAVLNHNEPVFYCVPRHLYETMLEAMDDAYLAKLVEERAEEEGFEVSLDEL